MDLPPPKDGERLRRRAKGARAETEREVWGVRGARAEGGVPSPNEAVSCFFLFVRILINRTLD